MSLSNSNITSSIINNFDQKRTIVQKNNHYDLPKNIVNKNLFGLSIYLILIAFALHYLIKHKKYLLASILLMNIDLFAIVLGFKGGPQDIWQYLYNPLYNTHYSFFSTTLINFLTLFGIGIICFIYARKTNIYQGIARYSIIILITYLLPGMYLVYYMNNFADYLSTTYDISYNIIYLLTLVFGFLFILLVVCIEFFFFKNCVKNFAQVIKELFNKGKLHLLD